MPLLAGLVSSLFTGFAAFIAQIWTRKVAIVVIAGGSLSLALVALLVVFEQLVKPMIAAMFQTQYGQFIGLAFPPISGTCMASIAACWSACALYKLKVQSIKLTASA